MTAYGGRNNGLLSAGVMRSGNAAASRALNGNEFYQPLYENYMTHAHPLAAYAAEHEITPDETCATAIDTLHVFVQDGWKSSLLSSTAYETLGKNGFQIVNHSIALSLQKKMFQASKEFFDLFLHEKMKLDKAKVRHLHSFERTP